MRGPKIPDGYSFDTLKREHDRKSFLCNQPAVDDWLKTKALQSHQKHLATTKVLLSGENQICGFYTLVTTQVDFSDLPAEEFRKLPRRALPVATLAWLGVDQKHQKIGLGQLLLVQSLRDCYEAGRIFAFVAVIIDCIDDSAKAFYMQYEFREMTGNPYRLFLSFERLESMFLGV